MKLMRMVLTKLGYTDVCVAHNGVAALELIEARRAAGPNAEIQMIFMDVAMDVMDGMECTRALRAREAADPTSPRIFILAQTANVLDETRRQCASAGMDAFSVKPIVIEQIMAAIKEAHRRTIPNVNDKIGKPSAKSL